MQYQVPQFIEVEDKIFGPFTFRQFVYMAGAGGITLLFFTLFPWWIWIPLSLPFVGLGLGLAFYKINGRPLISAIEHGVKYYFGSKLYLWKQREAKNTPAPKETPRTPASSPITVAAVSESRLKDLAWSLNIKDRQKMGVVSDKPTGFEV